MKIVIEAQHAVSLDQPRGVGYYSIHLIKALLRRGKHDYGLSFFDINRENGNYLRAEERFGEYKVPFYECTALDYRVAIRDESIYSQKSYNEHTGADGEVFHFTNFITVPTKLDGDMLTTVHDLNWIGYSEGTSPTLLPLLRVSLDRMVRLKPDVIADSESAKREILEYTDIPDEKIHVVYQSYDEENLFPDKANTFAVTPVLDYNYDYLLFIGTFERKKNITGIVRAFNQIAGKFKGLRLVLAGKPTWDDPAPIYEEIRESPFTNRIIVPGYISTDEKRLLYSNALGFIFPSVCEGFGIPVLEAMACECPVITADNTSLPEVGGDAVIYVNAANIEQLSFEMERLVLSESLRSELRRKGLKQVKHFTWEKTAENVENIYQVITRG